MNNSKETAIDTLRLEIESDFDSILTTCAKRGCRGIDITTAVHPSSEALHAAIVSLCDARKLIWTKTLSGVLIAWEGASGHDSSGASLLPTNPLGSGTRSVAAVRAWRTITHDTVLEVKKD